MFKRQTNETIESAAMVNVEVKMTFQKVQLA